MGEVRQLVQVVRHARQCTEVVCHALRHGFLDITVYRPARTRFRKAAAPSACCGVSVWYNSSGRNRPSRGSCTSRRRAVSGVRLCSVPCGSRRGVSGSFCHLLPAAVSGSSPAWPAVLWDTKPILAPGTHVITSTHPAKRGVITGTDATARAVRLPVMACLLSRGLRYTPALVGQVPSAKLCGHFSAMPPVRPCRRSTVCRWACSKE